MCGGEGDTMLTMTPIRWLKMDKLAEKPTLALAISLVPIIEAESYCSAMMTPFSLVRKCVPNTPAVRGSTFI